MTATAGNEDGKWSDRKMEGEGGLKTVECLRGRLLAERQASRAAKEGAELMGKKLVELKSQLNEEMKMKDKAEKKLKFLKRKLESLKMSSISEQSEQSSCSKNSEKSCTQSTATSSGSNDPDAHEPKSKVSEPEISEESSQNATNRNESPSTEETTSAQSIRCSSPEGFCHNPTHKSEDSKIDDNSYSTLNSSMGETENDENDQLDYVDNRLALVPAPATSMVSCHTSSELQPLSESVRQVLDALRIIRENLQSSMEKRHVIRVGPYDQTQTCK